jgi:hypothetical protein
MLCIAKYFRVKGQAPVPVCNVKTPRGSQFTGFHHSHPLNHIWKPLTPTHRGGSNRTGWIPPARPAPVPSGHTPLLLVDLHWICSGAASQRG